MEAEAFQFGGPTSTQWVVLVLVILVVGIVLIVAARRFGGGDRKKKKAVGAGWHNFYQIAKTRNLSKNETETLKQLVVTYGLSKPALIFTSTHILDSCIQRSVRKLGIQDIKGESKEDVISSYYRLRNKVVRNRGVKGIATTKNIPVGAQLRIGVENYGTFPADVNRNVDGYLGIGVPIHPRGKMVPWSKQKVTCSYWKDDDASYNFDTKVIDVIVEDEAHSICLKHTDKIIRVQKRRHPRKSMSLPVIYSRVKLIQEEGKKKAVVDRKDSHWGTILDVSVGGCSVETAIPIDKNNYVKTQFDLREDYKIVAFGKVKRIERNPGRKTWIMHIQFTKIDKKHKNEIFAFLYNYQII